MTHTSNADGSSAVLTEEEEAKSRSGASQEADGEDATTTTVMFALERVHICGHRHSQQHRRCCHGSEGCGCGCGCGGSMTSETLDGTLEEVDGSSVTSYCCEEDDDGGGDGDEDERATTTMAVPGEQDPAVALGTTAGEKQQRARDDDDDDDEEEGARTPPAGGARSDTSGASSSPAATGTAAPASPPPLQRRRSILRSPSLCEHVKDGKGHWKALPAPDLEAIRRAAAAAASSLSFSENDRGTSAQEAPDAAAGDVGIVSSSGPLCTGTDGRASNPKQLRRSATTAGGGSGVTFSEVHVRSYAQTVGDNPSVSWGPPISLDWHYLANDPVNVDDYEISRSGRRRSRRGGETLLRDLSMPSYHRRHLLCWKFGHSEQEVFEAERLANRAKRERAVTAAIDANPLLPKLEEAMQSAARKARRFVSSRRVSGSSDRRRGSRSRSGG